MTSSSSSPNVQQGQPHTRLGVLSAGHLSELGELASPPVVWPARGMYGMYGDVQLQLGEWRPGPGLACREASTSYDASCMCWEMPRALAQADSILRPLALRDSNYSWPPAGAANPTLMKLLLLLFGILCERRLCWLPGTESSSITSSSNKTESKCPMYTW